MNDTMQAISQDELGGPEVLKLVDLPIPEPGMGEILVRVHAAGVNPVDVKARQTGVFVGEPPFVLGWDVSGTVEAVGLGVTLYKPGDEVFGMLPFPQGHGAHAEYVIAPARAFVPQAGPPRPRPGRRAAAGRADRLAGPGGDRPSAAGQRVLIHAAAGGVGHVAVQIAKARGAYVIALARPRSRLPALLGRR